MTSSGVQRRLAAILAADVVGYSRLMREDEEGTLAALNGHLAELVRPCIGDHRGRVVKTTGDGLLAEFASVTDAVRCALVLQDGMRRRNAACPQPRRLEFRVGINLGDVILQDGDLFGDGVNVAARLEGLASAGGICVSDAVYQSVRSKVDAAFEDLGLQQVKNIADPVHVYRLCPGTEAAAAPPNALPLPVPERPSIAVLPFDNLSGDPQQEYFSDGITEDIIAELSKISGLLVIARHSTFIYKGRSVGLKEVGRDLNVRYVLEGSVRKAGNRLRISVQLVDATTEHHLWSDRYDRELEDVFAIQDEVARNVTTALVVALKPGESARLGRPLTSSIRAYDLYLRTRATLWPPTRENILTARSAYERIAQLEPDFAGGHSGRALTYALAVIFGHSVTLEEDQRLAVELATAAVALHPGFAQAHSALGLARVTVGEHAAALESAGRALELQPGDADVHLISTLIYLFAGLFDQAHRAISTCLRLDPQYEHGPYLNILGIVCCFAGRYAEAIDAFEKNLARGGPLAPPAVAFRTASYQAAGRLQEAEASARALMNFLPSFAIGRFPFFRMFASTVDTGHVVEALHGAGLPG